VKRVAVTRPKKSWAAAAALLRQHGLEPAGAPLVELVPRKDGSLKAFFERLQSGGVDAVILTSQNCVDIIFGREDRPPGLAGLLNGVAVVCIGPKTCRALAERGIRATRQPATFSSEGIVRDFAARLAGKRVEVLRSGQGSAALIPGLEAAGASVQEVVVYDLVPLDGPEQEAFVREALAGTIDGYTFTSTMTAKSLLMLGERMGVLPQLKAALNAGRVAAIGGPTADFLRQSGVRVDAVPEKSTFEDLVAALLLVL